jgi:signal peptidase I
MESLTSKKWKPNLALLIMLTIFFLPLSFAYLNKFRFFVLYFFAYVTSALLSSAYSYEPLYPQIFLAVIIIGSIHLILIYKHSKDDYTRKWYSKPKGLIALLALTLIIPVFVIRIFLVEPFRIPTGSMEPNLNIGDLIFVNKLGFGNITAFGYRLWQGGVTANFERGSILIFLHPDGDNVAHIKRVIGFPGDEILIRDKQVYIRKDCERKNKKCKFKKLKRVKVTENSLTDEAIFMETIDNKSYQIKLYPIVIEEQGSYNMSAVRLTVPEGHYFFLGDNRDNSNDSRFWGYVPEENLIGILDFVIENQSR